MNAQVKQPQTLMEAIKYFADKDVCHDFVEKMRWLDGVECPHCESSDIGRIESRSKYQCRACRRQFSVRYNTIFEDSKIALDKWLCAIWMIANARNGVSSYEIARSLGVTQKTGWFMLQRIRLAMQSKSIVKLGGEVEVDETYIGGKARFMHKDRREAYKGMTGGFNKVIVLGLLERDGEVRTEIIEGVKRSVLDPKVREHVEPGSAVYTDALPSYESLGDEYIHEAIDHGECYVRGKVHTNGLENYWSLFKRCIRGTYVNIQPYHLFRYLDEQSYRFNCRNLTDHARFQGVTRGIAGIRADIC